MAPATPRKCWYCGKPAAKGHMYCATCQRRVERTGCVDLNEWPTEEDSRRAWSPTAPVRAFVIGLVLLFAAPVLAEDFSRAEVLELLGQPVDEYDPTDAGPGQVLGYAPGTRVAIWDLEERPVFAAVSVKRPTRWLTTLVFDQAGQLLLARQQILGDLDAPVYDVTIPLKKLLRTRRT